MKKIILYTALLAALSAAGGATAALCQSPSFTQFVKNGAPLNMADLKWEINEGRTDTIQIYVQGVGGAVPYISATNLPTWVYFISPEGAASASLILMPTDDAQGDYSLTFEAFDKDPGHGQSTAQLALHVVDRNALTAADTKVDIINYPNPVTTTTTLEYVIPKAGHTTLRIYTLSGREVLALVNATAQPMRYFRKVDMSSYPAGTYVYHLQVDGVGSASGRMVKR
jgi:hypothetical protein